MRAGERAAEVARADLLQDHLLALVGLPVGRFGGVRVGEVLRGDIHADALGVETAAGDGDRFEEPHQAGAAPIAERMMLLRAPAHLRERLVVETVFGELGGFLIDAHAGAVGPASTGL